jgi:hypothetical protein
MKSKVVFYCGAEIVWEGTPEHTPNMGEIVRINGKNYIAAKQHCLYSAADDSAEVGIIVAELSEAWLAKLNEKE